MSLRTKRGVQFGHDAAETFDFDSGTSNSRIDELRAATLRPHTAINQIEPSGADVRGYGTRPNATRHPLCRDRRRRLRCRRSGPLPENCAETNVMMSPIGKKAR